MHTVDFFYIVVPSGSLFLSLSSIYVAHLPILFVDHLVEFIPYNSTTPKGLSISSVLAQTNA